MVVEDIKLFNIYSVFFENSENFGFLAKTGYFFQKSSFVLKF